LEGSKKGGSSFQFGKDIPKHGKLGLYVRIEE